MALTDSLPTGDAGGLTVADERLILAGLIAANADGTPRVGVFSAGSSPIVTGRASMGYDIAPFKAATSRTGTGVELLANDATVTNVPTDAAPGANSRIDVIYVRPQFTANTDPGSVPIFGVAKGTAAPVPTKPPIPDGALELAYADIPSTATTTASVVITQSAPFTAAVGGIVPVRNTAELDAFAAADGTMARDITVGIEYERDGGTWKLRGSIFHGTGVRRAASSPRYGQIWYDTDGVRDAWIANRAGGWRRYSGVTTIPPGAWNNSFGGAVWARTVVQNLPTVLEEDETIIAQAISTGSGYGAMALRSVGASSGGTTPVTVGQYQFGSAVTNLLGYAWQIVKRAGT